MCLVKENSKNNKEGFTDLSIWWGVVEQSMRKNKPWRRTWLQMADENMTVRLAKIEENCDLVRLWCKLESGSGGRLHEIDLN